MSFQNSRNHQVQQHLELLGYAPGNAVNRGFLPQGKDSDHNQPSPVGLDSAVALLLAKIEQSPDSPSPSLAAIALRKLPTDNN